MTLEDRAKAILIEHDCPPGHRAIAAMLQMAAEQQERDAKVADLEGHRRGISAGGAFAASAIAAAIRNMEQGQ